MKNNENLIINKENGQIYYEELTKENIDIKSFEHSGASKCFGCTEYFNCPKSKMDPSLSVAEIPGVTDGFSIIENGENVRTHVSDCAVYRSENMKIKKKLSSEEKKAILEEFALYLRPTANNLDDALLGMVQDRTNTLVEELNGDIFETNKSKKLTKKPIRKHF